MPSALLERLDHNAEALGSGSVVATQVVEGGHNTVSSVGSCLELSGGLDGSATSEKRVANVLTAGLPLLDEKASTSNDVDHSLTLRHQCLGLCASELQRNDPGPRCGVRFRAEQFGVSIVIKFRQVFVCIRIIQIYMMF